MIGLRVRVNGQHLCVAGAEDMAVLNAIVNAVGNLGALTVKQRPDETPEIYLRVGGLTGRADGQDEHLTWAGELRLKPGDKVEVEVLETSEAEPPKTARVQDKERQRQKERENYEYAKEVYFTFKPKFEPD